MNIIKSIIADCEALLKRIETEIGGTHATVSNAASSVKSAASQLAQHPDATAAASTIVSPGKDAPEAAMDAPAATPAPATDTAEVGTEKAAS